VPRRSFPCAACGEPLRPGPNSLPEGKARHRRCAGQAAAEPVDDEPLYGPRAQRLVEQLSEGVTDAARLALVDEVARTADRLDNLDSIIRGKGVLNLLRFRLRDIFEVADERKVTVVVTFDGVMSETRQTTLAFRQLLMSLALSAPPAAVPAPEKKGTALDELERRRAARMSGTSGLPGP